MKKSELKELIRELYTEELSTFASKKRPAINTISEKKDEEEDTEEVDIEDEGEEMEMDVDMNDGEGDNEIVLDALTKALEQAKEMGDEKLIDQIGNTITFFTRTHIVGKETPINEVKRFKTLAGIIK
jgi:23S rRNA pseudoU1915 N3-methylase RlmH